MHLVSERAKMRIFILEFMVGVLSTSLCIAIRFGLTCSQQLGMSVLSVSDVKERSTETRCCYQLSKFLLRHKKIVVEFSGDLLSIQDSTSIASLTYFH